MQLVVEQAVYVEKDLYKVFNNLNNSLMMKQEEN